MVDTLSQLLLNSVRSYPKDGFLLVKKQGAYAPISTGAFGDAVKFLGLGLRALGFSKGDKLIILSENRPEWTITDFACLSNGGITVPIYTTLVPEQMKYIINDSDAKIVVYSNPDQWKKIDEIKAQLPQVKHFITFEPEAPPGVMTYGEILSQGEAVAKAQPDLFERLALSIKPEDEASIVYTSGTTGVPKGVILTHSNFISNVKTAASLLDFSDKDTVLSFCPLSHVMERMVTFAYIYRGCTIGYAESLETVAANLLEVRPHIMVGVPRVFEKIYSRVMDNILKSSSLKRKIFFWAVKIGKAYGTRTLNKQPIGGFLQFKRNLAHKLVFSKILERTGGRVRFFVSGAAPLSKDIAEFFYAMGMVILEGYGLTETSPVIAVNVLENPKFGTVGKPIPGIEVKIAPDGEILTRGPHVMKGYYKKETETQEVFEGDWLKTGDIGRLDEEGFLMITDRKKDLIVTAGGKNVAPQAIENVLKTNPYISNAVAIGDRRRFISALIVPNFEKLEEYAKFNNVAYASRAELVKNEQVVNFLKSEIDRATPNLASFERIKKIAVLDRDFEIEKGELTPTQKVKRNVVEKKYKDLLDMLYREDIG
jgi:long-chain acyl-CoA synthetase